MKIPRTLRIALHQRLRAAALFEKRGYTDPEVRIVDGGNPLMHILVSAALEFAENIFVKKIERHGIALGSTPLTSSTSSNAPASARAAKTDFKLSVG